MHPRAALLRYPLFAALGPPRLDDWLAAGTSRAAALGETLLRAGTPGEHIYFVLEGRVRVLRPGKGDREVPLGCCGPGDAFGEYALLPPGQNTATCRAAEPSRLLRLPLGPLSDAVASRPAVADRLKGWLRLHAALHHFRDRCSLGFLSAPSVLGLVDRFEPAAFRAGHAAQADGLNADRLFVVLRGELALHEGGHAGPSTLHAGDCFGAAALLGEELPLVEAVTDAECAALSRAAFEARDGDDRFQTFAGAAAGRRGCPWVAQEGASDCGAACLAMVARFHDFGADPAAIRERLRPGPQGSSLRELQEAAEGLGFRARAVRVGAEQLAAVALPAVAHLADGHYVVLYAVQHNAVVAGDPAAGVVALDAAAFARSWSGHLLLIVRRGDTVLLPAKPPTPPSARMHESPLDTVRLHACLDALRAGDRRAADELLAATCGRLEQLARRMLKKFPNVRRWADTDDILQNALLRLLRTLEALRPASTADFANLAALHIRRELLDLARHFRGRLDRPGDRAAAALAAPGAAPERGGADDLELWGAFHEAVERLPAAEREVVGLTFYHGWTQAQIAELFAVDERTVRRRWRSACLRLGEALGGRLPEV
jgi:RNA polymerase sigma-70 factor (ECF subfamily)